MSRGLELYESRIDHVTFAEGAAHLHFSHAYIYQAKDVPGRDPGSTWSMELELVLPDAQLGSAVPPLPDGISEGFLEIGDERHEVIPLPLPEAAGAARLWLRFAGGGTLDIRGKDPAIRLLGAAIHLEDFI